MTESHIIPIIFVTDHSPRTDRVLANAMLLTLDVKSWGYEENLPGLRLNRQSWAGWLPGIEEHKIQVTHHALTGIGTVKHGPNNPPPTRADLTTKLLLLEEENRIPVFLPFDVPATPFFVLPGHGNTSEFDVRVKLLIDSLVDLPQLDYSKARYRVKPSKWGESVLKAASLTSIGSGHWLPITMETMDNVISAVLVLKALTSPEVYDAHLYLSQETPELKFGQELKWTTAWIEEGQIVQSEKTIAVIVESKIA